MTRICCNVQSLISIVVTMEQLAKLWYLLCYIGIINHLLCVIRSIIVIVTPFTHLDVMINI